MEKRKVFYTVNWSIREYDSDGSERAGYTEYSERYDDLADAAFACCKKFDELTAHPLRKCEAAQVYVMPEVLDDNDCPQEVGSDQANRYELENWDDSYWETVNEYSFDSREVKTMYCAYGVFECKFCEDDEILLEFDNTEDKAANWCKKHCLPGGIKYYKVKFFHREFPSKVVKQDNSCMGHIWYLENGCIVDLTVDDNKARLELLMNGQDVVPLDWKDIDIDEDAEEYDWDEILSECEDTMWEKDWISK